MKNFLTGIAVLLGVFGLGVAFLILAPPPRATTTIGTEPVQAVQPPRVPDKELAFVQIVETARNRWLGAPNSIQREPMRADRDKALCSDSTAVSGWLGRVKYIGTYVGSKNVSVHVEITPHITLRTEGDLQDLGTKIQRGTKLFQQVANLAVGQSITFSGRFVKGENTCLLETSLTDGGSMTDPDFEFTFIDFANWPR